MNSDRLADYLQTWGFEGDFVIFSDGSLGFALEATPIDVSCHSNDARNQLAQGLSQFLNGLQPEIDVQFVQDIKGGNEAIIASHLQLAEGSKVEAAKHLCSQRAEQLRHYDSQGVIPAHSLKIIVRKPMTQALVEKPRLFSKKPQFEAVSEERLAREIIQAERLVESISQGLKSLGMEVRQLQAKDVAGFMYEQWNPERSISENAYDPENLRSSLLFTDVGIYEKGFSFADLHHRVVSLKILPDQTFSAMAAHLRMLPFDSRLFVSVHVPNQMKELESLQTQRRLAFSMARGKKTGVSDIESEAKLQDLETLLEQMIAQGEKVFHVSVNVLLRGKDLQELEDKVSQTLMVFREMSGAEAMEETLASFSIFSEMALPNARSKERSKRVKTSNLCDLLPIYGPWGGFKRPSILLRSPMGSLICFDPFGPELTNYNQLISGGSGAGKSFLTNILLLQMLKENPQVFFVDIGGSYKKLCENLSGQYLPLGVDAGISINPFDLVPGESVPSDQKIKFLVSLVEIMTKEDHEARLPRLERSEIEEAIQKVFETSKAPRFSDLREILMAHTDPTIRRYGRILSTWCGDSPYGRFIDQPTNIEMKRPVVAFDLKGMETYPDLQAACLFIITDYVWRAVQKDRSTKKFLVFDECWKLLKNDSGLVFIEEVFRTFRKYYASAIAISQDIDDFAKSKIAGALLPNCSVKWLLMQNQSDSSRLKEVLGLNDNEVALVKGLYQEKGKFSEAFLMAQQQRCVAMIESTPLEYWIATTDPKDLSVIEERKAANPTEETIEALLALSKEYPRGAAAQQKEAKI